MIKAVEKTPISHLQEYMMKMGGYLPQYELVHSGCGTKVWFKYELKVSNWTVSGEGPSKKIAKHNTAKAMLVKLGLSKMTEPTAISGAANSINEHKANGTFNAIGTLNEHCSRFRLTAAKYDVINEVGPPHKKEFTVKCSVGNESVVATGNTIQNAKHQSAAKMLEKFNTFTQDELISLEEEDESTLRLTETQLVEIIQKFKISSSLMKQKKLPINTSELAFKDYHHVVKLDPTISSTVMNSLAATIRRKDFRCFDAELDINYDLRFEKLLKDLHLTHEFIVIPPHLKSRFPVIALNINYTIPLSFLGVGKTLSEAKKVASIDALNWLVRLYV